VVHFRFVAPVAKLTIDELLERERSLLQRLDPASAYEAIRRGGVLIDIRTHEQRVSTGVVPGALRIERNVLEWRADPSSGHQDARLAASKGPWIVMCDEGYASSLAAATLQRLGLTNATDLVGGFVAWKAAGLPTAPFDDDAAR
jgi:rhodanese-related sulfurtransferase